MARFPEIDALEARRRELVRQSELYRMSLTVEYYNIKARTTWMRQAVAVGRAASPWLAALAPLSALFFGKRRPAARSAVGKLVLGWQLVRGLTSLWRARSRDPLESGGHGVSSSGTVNGTDRS